MWAHRRSEASLSPPDLALPSCPCHRGLGRSRRPEGGRGHGHGVGGVGEGGAQESGAHQEGSHLEGGKVERVVKKEGGERGEGGR